MGYWRLCGARGVCEGAIIKVLIRACRFYICCLPVLLQYLQQYLWGFLTLENFRGGLADFRGGLAPPSPRLATWLTFRTAGSSINDLFLIPHISMRAPLLAPQITCTRSDWFESELLLLVKVFFSSVV